MEKVVEEVQSMVDKELTPYVNKIKESLNNKDKKVIKMLSEYRISLRVIEELI